MIFSNQNIYEKYMKRFLDYFAKSCQAILNSIYCGQQEWEFWFILNIIEECHNCHICLEWGSHLKSGPI